MFEKSTLRDWGIKKFKVVVGFSTKKYPEKSCWEMASEVGDFRSEFNICEDCIVFILKNGSTHLSKKELHSLRDRGISCKFYNG